MFNYLCYSFKSLTEKPRKNLKKSGLIAKALV